MNDEKDDAVLTRLLFAIVNVFVVLILIRENIKTNKILDEAKAENTLLRDTAINKCRLEMNK